MAIVRDDYIDELARMKEQGLLCMAEAAQRKDQQAFMLWQKCASTIDSLITESRKFSS